MTFRDWLRRRLDNSSELAHLRDKCVEQARQLVAWEQYRLGMEDALVTEQRSHRITHFELVEAQKRIRADQEFIALVWSQFDPEQVAEFIASKEEK